nr:MAG TPA: hypothetical protein [Caudoviricetes sp.]
MGLYSHCKQQQQVNRQQKSSPLPITFFRWG